MDKFNVAVNLTDFQSRLKPLAQALEEQLPYQSIKPTNIADSLAVFVTFLIALSNLTRGHLWDKKDKQYHVYFERPQVNDSGETKASTDSRDISERLSETDSRCIIFWGSQSGTSNRFADILGREILTNFGINALVADPSDFDMNTIQKIPESCIAIFILSTYGEGDPSDNTTGLWDWVKLVSKKRTKLSNLKYIAFGLGNSNYKYYNRVVDVVTDTLDAADATALMPRQKADDANGGTEEDFQSWKDDVFSLYHDMGYEQKSMEHQSTFTISFTGETNCSATRSSFPTTPSLCSAVTTLPIKTAHELFKKSDRNCIHLELDLGNTELVYKTGDHVGIWPCNPDEEVDHLVHALGLQNRRYDIFEATSKDGSKVNIPSPTTINTAFKHHLEICGPVTRKTVLSIAHFAPSSDVKSMLLEIARDRSRYEHFTSSKHITLARLLKFASPMALWTKLPLEFVIDCLRPLQPRYYSISSSSVLSPRKVAITALVVNTSLPDVTIPGLASNYLLSLSKLPTSSNLQPSQQKQKEETDVELLAHIIKSKFKLPITTSTPLILVCAGTGFAPFRAFLQERAKLFAIGKPIGRMLLFFGCRDQYDFIYQHEIESMQAQLGDRLEVFLAFSRTALPKVYVQDRVCEQAEKVLDLLESGANLYICGQAAMAREVDTQLEQAAGRTKQLNDAEVKIWADALKKRGKWKADVWG